MRRALSLVVLAGALLVGACDNDGDGGSVAASGGDFCDKVKVLDENDALDSSEDDTKEDQQRKAKESLDALEDLASDAPDEIEDDLDLLVEGLRPLLQAIADGKDLTTMSEDEQKQFEKISSEEYQQAGDRVNTYVEDECGVDTSE